MEIALSYDDVVFLENYGHSIHAPAYYYQPKKIEEIKQILEFAKKQELTIALRGAGRSYNDAALNGGGIVLDLQKMNRILEWNSESGLIRTEPGVTLQQLWQCVLPSGWWPPVVSGTMDTTLGGCLGMNIHGKNNYSAGPIGDHVVQFDVFLPSGAEITCTPKKNSDLFYAMIGGLGMLGVFTSITLQMKRIYSGLLQVDAWNVPDLKSHLDALEEHKDNADYVVGWLDCTAHGRNLGRGQVHCAKYLSQGDDQDSKITLQVPYQTLPPRFFGIVPKSILHYFMAPFMTNLGVWGVNSAKYLVGRRKTYRQPHASFHFLLDYVPGWELAYGRNGLIQYQSFLPKETALDAWTEMLRLSKRRGLPSYLGVTKRHRTDQFLLTHAVDGYSLALDFKVTKRNRTRMAKLFQNFDRIVLDAGGRFYFAKNSETTPETARRFLGDKVIAKFRSLKNRCDPNNLLDSDLYRRVFGE